MVQLKSTPRPAAQAGRFYEADAARLRRHVEALLDERASIAPRPDAVAILAPHAGYAYSGPAAAAAYAVVHGRALDRVLILAPSHFADIRGGALPAHEAFATPLGTVGVDAAAVGALANESLFRIDREAHATEHSIEVQLPFVQVTLPGPPSIVPVLLGRTDEADLERMAAILLKLLTARRAAGERWLVVASSDTYHGYDTEACRANDERLAELVERMDAGAIRAAVRERDVMACGWSALVLMMMLATGLGARRGEVLWRADSQSAASRPGDYVVGYLAACFY